MGDNVEVTCPWCGEQLEVWVEADTEGAMIQDCDVCCRPQQLIIAWDRAEGRPTVLVQRA